MLANLLQHTGLDQRFFVTATPKLWTRTADGSSRLADVLANNAAATINDKLDALLSDCDDIPFKFYMQTVRRFFGEDLPRVIQLGDANWQSLDWHVGPKCSSCDWLGYGRWLGTADQQRVNARPQHYCAPNAELIDHLSRIVGVTKGARKTFGLHAITTSAAVAQTTGVERPYREHSLLRKERSRIPERASALQTNQVTIDQAALIANLARSPNLQLSIAVNFDAGAGLLTGLALSGRLSFPYRANPVRPLSLGSASYIIDAKLPRQEWVALEAFLLQIEQMIVRAEQEFANNNFWRDVKSDRTEG